MTNTSSKLYVGKIVCSTSTDGVGLRNSLYLTGCAIRCQGCHNSHLWDMKSGTERTVEDIFDELNQDDFNISILGGEPIMQYQGVLQLCRMIKERTDKTIWLYTGHTIEHLQFFMGDLLDVVDVVVDGPFIESLKDFNLRFRGSANQRIYKIEHSPQHCVSDISDSF